MWKRSPVPNSLSSLATVSCFVITFRLASRKNQQAITDCRQHLVNQDTTEVNSYNDLIMLLGNLISMNEEAVALIASGNPDLAAKRLRNVLSILRSVASHDQPRIPIRALLGRAEPRALPEMGFDSSLARSLGFYPKAFLIAGIPSSSLSVPHDQIRDYEMLIVSRLITPVLLYNFALALHLSADVAAERSALIAKANKLYFLSLQSFSEDQMEGNAQSLRLAAYSNMGSIHAHFHRSVQSQACFSVLQSSFDSILEIPIEERAIFQKLYLQTTLHSWKNAPAA